MIRLLIKIYSFMIMIDAILSFFPEMQKYEWLIKLKRLCDYACEPVRRRLPHHLPFDLAPMVVIFGLFVFMELFSYLW